MPDMRKADEIKDRDFFARCVAEALVLPSDLPTWRWLESNVELTSVESDLSGRVSFDYFPASKFFFDRLDNPRLKKCTVMKCSQSAFTQNAMWYVMRRIVDRPVTTMWVATTADKAQEDVKKRLVPALESCPAVRAKAPADNDRERWTRKLIMFDTMNFLVRGTQAVAGLRGDPVGLIICDERADWKVGRIHAVRNRTTTKFSPVEISLGAAGKKMDELHVDWIEGSQTIIHFTCPHCGADQPFRFGKKESVLFPEPRPRGGLVWDENDVTKPGGEWNYDEVKKTVRYECEGCGHKFLPTEKLTLLKSAHEHHWNPQALPENYSLHVSALVLVWPKRSWENIVVEFLRAVDALRHGDIEPMMSFVQETLGEPWELRNEKQSQNLLIERCGDYKLGEMWVEVDGSTPKDSTLILTYDRQQFHLVYIIRQWRKNGRSRLIECGVVPTENNLRDLAIKYKIRPQCIWGDDGGQLTAEHRQNVLRFGWNLLKGEDFPHYSFNDGKPGGKSWRQGWRKTEFDPGIGTTAQGRATMPAFLFSSPWYKDKLYNIFVPGKSMLWENPRDIPSDYLKQVMANEWREKTKQDGRIEGFWYETGPDHFADCEIEQLVVADIGGLTRYLPEQAQIAKQ